MRQILLASALFFSIAATAQSSYGYYALHNMNSGLRNGWGFGMNGLSAPKWESSPVKLQFGAGYNVLWAGARNFKDVVLADGQSPSDVAFTNMQYGFHGIFRVSVPSPNGKFTPYAEISPGVGLSTSTVDIYNEDEECNIYTPNKTAGFNLGLGAGMLIKLNDMVAVDAGMTWDKNYNRGNMIMMNTVDVSDGISYGMKAAPSNVVCFRIGVRVFISGDDDCCSFSGCTIKSHHKSCGHTELPHR